MHQSIRGLLVRTVDLQRDIEAVLAVKMPVASLDIERAEQQDNAEQGVETLESAASSMAGEEGSFV